jgi:tRNA threonylcarbamoyl adenosine modification protein (Sua5/YciO/YrdC/YwlC family)
MTRRFDMSKPLTRAQGLKAASTSAQRGRVVLLPTESVYAVLGDAFSATGVRAVRTLKNRPDDAALPVAVSSLSMLRGIAERLTPAGQSLVEAFWPGPLTIVCRAQPSLAWAAGGGGRTLTVRMPLHPVALDVIRDTGPSVLVGADPPLDADPAGHETPGIDVVLDAGPPPWPAQRSTVVDVRVDPPVLMREGALGHDRLVLVAGDVVFPSRDEATR